MLLTFRLYGQEVGQDVRITTGWVMYPGTRTFAQDYSCGDFVNKLIHANIRVVNDIVDSNFGEYFDFFSKRINKDMEYMSKLGSDRIYNPWLQPLFTNKTFSERMRMEMSEYLWVFENIERPEAVEIAVKTELLFDYSIRCRCNYNIYANFIYRGYKVSYSDSIFLITDKLIGIANRPGWYNPKNDSEEIADFVHMMWLPVDTTLAPNLFVYTYLVSSGAMTDYNYEVFEPMFSIMDSLVSTGGTVKGKMDTLKMIFDKKYPVIKVPGDKIYTARTGQIFDINPGDTGNRRTYKVPYKYKHYNVVTKRTEYSDVIYDVSDYGITVAVRTMPAGNYNKVFSVGYYGEFVLNTIGKVRY